jgi:hypothetical protein
LLAHLPSKRELAAMLVWSKAPRGTEESAVCSDADALLAELERTAR